MWNDLKKIENLDEYISKFDLLEFVETIKVVPKGWYQSRVGRDDNWGTKLSFEENFLPDSYFLIKKFLLHPSFENNLSSEHGWTAAYKSLYDNTVLGTNEEWAIAKKAQGEICYNVLSNYSYSEHKEILKKVNTLDEFELKDLQKLYFKKVEFICIRKYSHAICEKTSGSDGWISNLKPKALLGLIKKDFFKTSKISVMVDDIATDVLDANGKFLFKKNGRFEEFSQDNLKEKLEKTEFQEEVLDRFAKFER